jgi:hypothetical protein
VFDTAPVMAGQVWCSHDGKDYIAMDDGVRITVLGPDGAPVATVFQTTDSAIALALTIQDAAVKSTANGVGDDGKKIPIAERLARLSNAYKKAGR